MEDLQRRIGETVREFRKTAGFTQDTFADRTGLNRAHVGEIERGECNLTIQTLKIIADALGAKSEIYFGMCESDQEFRRVARPHQKTISLS